MSKPKPPSLVTIAIMTLITVVFWTFFSVYRVLTDDQPIDIPEEVLKPINPTLDEKAMSELEKRFYLEENEIPELILRTPEPSPTLTPIPEEPPIVTEEPIESTPTPSTQPEGATKDIIFWA